MVERGDFFGRVNTALSSFMHSRDHLLFWCFLALFLLAPLPLGSNRLWAWPFVASLTFVLLGGWFVQILRGDVHVPGRLGGGLMSWNGLLLVSVWLVVQTLALPTDWLARFSPATVAAWADVLNPLPTSLSISLDPTVTATHVVRSLAYAAVFLLFLLLIHSENRVRLFLYTLVIAGVFQAFYGGLAVLGGPEYSLLFMKQYYVDVATGTFVNRNHLAGCLEMTIAAGVGLLLAGLKGRRHGSWRLMLSHWIRLILSEKAAIRLSLIIMATAMVLTRSRMGNIAFLTSLSVAGMLSLILSRTATRSSILLFASVIIIDMVLLGSWFGMDKVVQRIEQTTLAGEQRDDVDVFAWPMVQDFWLTGSGGGSFAVVFPHYITEHLGEPLFDHAHNDYFEFWAELGVAGCLPLALVTLASLVMALRCMGLKHHPVLKGAGFTSVMGIVSVLIHSFVDFNLQIPANAIYFVSLLALPWACWSLAQKQHQQRVRHQMSAHPVGHDA